MRWLVIAVLTALMTPAAAQAWTPPTNLGKGAAPVVLSTVVAFNGPGSIPGAPLMRSVYGGAPTVWDDGHGAFDSTFGAFGSNRLYIGTKGRRVEVARRHGENWTFSLVGPRTGGARVAAADGAVAFSTFERGDVGRVYYVRGAGKTHRLSARGHIRSVAIATDPAGDTLVAWDLKGEIQAVLVRAGKAGPVKTLGKVTAAMDLSAAVKDARHALVAWVDQGTTARVQESVDFGKPQTLETFPDATHPSGEGVATAYTRSGTPILAWSGRNAVRAKVGEALQDVAPIGPSENYLAYGLGDLAVSGDQALISMGAETGQVYAAVLQGNGFGSAEPVGAPAGTLYGRTSAGFDAGVPTVAWSAGGSVFTSTR